ncbi:MAG: hypothetical protein ABL921_13120 [Pirellula sp.]
MAFTTIANGLILVTMLRLSVAHGILIVTFTVSVLSKYSWAREFVLLARLVGMFPTKSLR